MELNQRTFANNEVRPGSVGSFQFNKNFIEKGCEVYINEPGTQRNYIFPISFRCIYQKNNSVNLEVIM